MTRVEASDSYRTVLFHQKVMMVMWLFIYRKLLEIIIKNLAVDGLRQDVLYGADEASYADPSGCGQDVSCNIEVNETNLPGLSRIMGADSTIKLKNVTSVFPSITLASWASVFTGKMPGETGILGNEFFARDLSVSTPDLPGISVPRELNNPPGIISLSSGAFEGYDEFGLLNGLLTSKFFVPYQPDWKVPPIDNIEKTPQNDRRVLLQDTVYESIAGISGHSDTGMEGVKQYFAARGGDPVVVANNHYARGAYWLTWDIEIGSGESQILDKASWDKLDDYLQGKYMESGERNGVPFSALTVWYLPGLDHEAHGKGMGVYRDYFINTTDNYINKVMETLKDMGEFDNKIFIIVADHGHTAMPQPEQMKLEEKDENDNVIKTWYGDASCKLNVKGFGNKKTQLPELANNNLHIWELGTLFTTFAPSAAGIKLLAPSELNNTGINTTQNPTDANVITALNGPMAHIYVKGDDWRSNPDVTRLGIVLDTLIRVLTLGENATDKVKKEFNSLYGSVDKILVRRTLNGPYEVVKSVTEDAVGNVIIDTDSLNALNKIDYIDAVTRISGMNHKDRSGDIILIMKDATAGDSIDRYTTGVSCKSWHGSLNPSDSYVPFIVTYPGGNKYEFDAILNTVCQGNNCEGNWNLTELVREIVINQYSGQ